MDKPSFFLVKSPFQMAPESWPLVPGTRRSPASLALAVLGVKRLRKEIPSGYLTVRHGIDGP